MHAAPAAVSTASSVASAAEGQTAGHDDGIRSTGNLNRGEEHHDVTFLRVKMVQRLREMGGRAHNSNHHSLPFYHPEYVFTVTFHCPESTILFPNIVHIPSM